MTTHHWKRRRWKTDRNPLRTLICSINERRYTRIHLRSLALQPGHLSDVDSRRQGTANTGWAWDVLIKKQVRDLTKISSCEHSLCKIHVEDDDGTIILDGCLYIDQISCPKKRFMNTQEAIYLTQHSVEIYAEFSYVTHHSEIVGMADSRDDVTA